MNDQCANAKERNRGLCNLPADVVPLPLPPLMNGDAGVLLGDPLLAGTTPVGAMPSLPVPVVPLSPVDESLSELLNGGRTVTLVQLSPASVSEMLPVQVFPRQYGSPMYSTMIVALYGPQETEIS
jgi:hypothetical protein